MRPMISRVTASIVAPDYGKVLSPGLVVDLDERLPAGGSVADAVRAEWFEAMPDAGPEKPPRLRRVTSATETTIPPVSPASEEDHG